MNAQKYPIDFSALKKGDIIDRKDIEDIFAVKAGDKKYAFKCLALAGQIEDYFDSRGVTVVCVQRDYNLVLLTDKEASPYLFKRSKYHERGLVRSAVNINGVDTTEFSEDEKKNHVRRAEISTRAAQAVLTVRGKVLPDSPYQRIVPKRLK